MATDNGWRSRIVRHARRSPKALMANPKNFRTHPPEQRAAMIAVLDDVGWVQDVVVNERTGMLIDGHLRTELAVERGERTIPIVYVDLSPEEEATVLATLDPLAAMATVNTERLESLLRELTPSDDAIRSLLDNLASSADIELHPPPEGLTDPDDVPDAPAESYVKRGEIYALGDHRVMCGDATSADDVERLLSGERPPMMFTDPPYGVVFGSAKKNAIAGDLTQATIPIAFAVAVDHALDDDARLYLCGGSGNYEMYGKLFEHHLQQRPHPLIWVKESFVMRPNNYHSQFEIIYFGWKGSGGGSDFWYGDRKQSDVWEVHRDRDHEHPTQKPVELVERALVNSSQPADSVFDPFLGSGTTVIAAERLGRRCYGMEISERYTQVTIERWEQFTGQKAERI